MNIIAVKKSLNAVTAVLLAAVLSFGVCGCKKNNEPQLSVSGIYHDTSFTSEKFDRYYVIYHLSSNRELTLGQPSGTAGPMGMIVGEENIYFDQLTNEVDKKYFNKVGIEVAKSGDTLPADNKAHRYAAAYYPQKGSLLGKEKVAFDLDSGELCLNAEFATAEITEITDITTFLTKEFGLNTEQKIDFKPVDEKTAKEFMRGADGLQFTYSDGQQLQINGDKINWVRVYNGESVTVTGSYEVGEGVIKATYNQNLIAYYGWSMDDDGTVRMTMYY